MKRFNRYVIEEIQRYLTELNCAQQKECTIEKLDIFLDGVRYALGCYNLRFQLKRQSTGKFDITVMEYQDLKDDWGNVKYIGVIDSDIMSVVKGGKQ